MSGNPIPIVRQFALLFMLSAAAGCGVAGKGGAFRPAEGQYLPPGPLRTGGAGDLRSSPALPTSPTGRTIPAGSVGTAGMPAGLTAGEGTSPLPGAGMPGVGPVHGLVIPVSLGPRIPLRDDVALMRELFAAESGTGQSLVDQMRQASGGAFRPSFEVLPSLVDSRTNVLSASPAPRVLMEFAQAVLQTAGQRTDLTRFDNDGPDGIPSSSDDDGRLDFLLLVVETDEAFPSVTLRQDFPITSGGRTVSSGPVHVLSLSRSEAVDVRPAIGLWLDGLGLDPGERFFPSTFPRGISSLARVRLGWLPVQPVVNDSVVTLADGRALLYPLQDVSTGSGFWLIEREGERAFVSRVARKGDGHFFATEAHALRPGQGQVLPLTRQFGERGSRVVLRWPETGAGPEAELVSVPTRAADPVPLRRTMTP